MLTIISTYGQNIDSIRYFNKKAIDTYRNNSEEALNYLNEAELLLQEFPNDSLKAKVNQIYAFTYYLKGNYKESLSYYLSALNGFKRLQDEHNMARCYNGLGLIQQGIGRHNQAIQYFEKYLEFVDDKDPSAAYLNLGISYLALNQIDKASQYFDESFKFSITSENKSIKLAAKNRIAQVYYLEENLEEAILTYNQVINESKNDNWELTFAYGGLAEIYIKLNEQEKALSAAQKSYQAAIEIDALWDLERSTALLAKIQVLKEDYKTAYRFSRDNRKYKDSLFNKEQAQIIAVMQLDKKEAENEILTTKNQQSENKIFFNQLVTALIALILVITLFFAFKYKKIINEKEELNTALAHKNRQLVKLDKGKNKLFSIISHDLRSPIAAVSQVMDLLLQNAFTEEEKIEVYSSMRLQLDETSRMLNNLLIWASTQLNGTKINFTKINIVSEMIEILNVYKISSQSKGVTIIHNIYKEAIMITVDTVQLHVILHNLLSNALKYTPKEKSIKISYQIKPEHIEIHIFNEGTPISKDQLDKIFSENNSSITSLKGTDGEFGTGLGLFLIKKYVELNKAEFAIQPIENKGTLVVLCFDKS
ncbi:tetratricopeptide repeat protein [Mesonia sp. K4-1]|uniref:tetratricopeptide repeat-containing sensor histidine kinase n=1 Tax=Mesonia sp. K4-1 TaxID=2602760 RepID=UPI0011CABFE0|nr:tetratricopeptide repeat protein [Mesonia sp. K4-1]TXK72877.1 sensor histidine kinase [Mesonia sp. K4-1]